MYIRNARMFRCSIQRTEWRQARDAREVKCAKEARGTRKARLTREARGISVASEAREKKIALQSMCKASVPLGRWLLCGCPYAL
jgi:hypothetical protein